MREKGKFLLQVRIVLLAMIAGADIEKVRRHWPDYVLEVGDDHFVFRLRKKEEKDVVATPLDPKAEELRLAKAAVDSSVAPINPLTPVV